MFSFSDLIFSLAAALMVASCGVAWAFARPAWLLMHTIGRCDMSAEAVPVRFAASTFLGATAFAVLAAVLMLRTFMAAWNLSFRPWLAFAVLYITFAAIVKFYLAMTAWYYGVEARTPDSRFKFTWFIVLAATAGVAWAFAYLMRHDLI